MKRLFTIAIDIAKPVAAAATGIELADVHLFLSCSVLILTAVYTTIKIRNEILKQDDE